MNKPYFNNQFDLYKNIYIKNKKIYKIFILFIIFIIYIIFILEILNIVNNNLFNPQNLYFIKQNKFNLSKYIKNKTQINFNLTSLLFSYNSIDNIIKVQYTIDFYDENKNLIIPSDLILYNNLHIFCLINDKTNNLNVISFANILKNRHYECVEFSKFKNSIYFGILINDTENNIYTKINLFSNLKIIFFYYNYQINKINNNQFNCAISNQEYMDIIQNHDNKERLNNSLNLRLSYIKQPICFSSFLANMINNEWDFINLYNNYFCICRGFDCIYKDVPQKYKYYFYLNIIDNSRYLYNKTDYLFGDFLYSNLSSDDTYPIFEEMIKQNLSVHYLTQKEDIYKKYCDTNKNCLSVLPLFETVIINGDFLEKYLTIFLKLKAAITGAEFFYIDNLFKNIDYITHICVGHGVSFFKSFLYEPNAYYGNEKFNKILIPPSPKLVSIVKKYNWTDENIIKINLPRWYKYDIFEKYQNQEINNKSIFIMFTWRVIRNNQTISSYYINNIQKLINNKLLTKSLKRNNITLYYTLHHKFFKYKNIFQLSNYIKFINTSQISSILSNTNLIITDFSSIIFDLIYRNKPYIIFVPDSNDPLIENKYSKEYYKLIKDMKNNTKIFENIFFTVEEVINKIIYYINNNFVLEKKLKKFYDSFEFKHENSINKFIEYLKNL